MQIHTPYEGFWIPILTNFGFLFCRILDNNLEGFGFKYLTVEINEQISLDKMELLKPALFHVDTFLCIALTLLVANKPPT
jgi:hypothetical protein